MQKPQQKPITPVSLCDKWNRSTFREAHVTGEVLRLLKENPGIFDKRLPLQETLRNMQTLDSRFEKTGGVFFHTGKDAFETAKAFTDIHMERYRYKGRPSLAALAIHHAEHMGLDNNSSAYKALLMVAIRAEMRTATATPEYHSRFHYMDVAAMTANLLEKNSEMARAHVTGFVSLTPHEQALTFLAAMGHDLEHEGVSNPPDDPIANEKKSFEAMEPLLKAAGLSEVDMSKIFTILKTTSPDGPHAILKAAALAQRTGRAADYSKVARKKEFSELQALQLDVKLTQMAAMVSDSDLYASSGAGLRASRINSKLLTAEMQKAGNDCNLTSDEARKYFLDNIVGKEGYASHAGRVVAGESLEALRRETELRIASAPKPPAP